MENKEYWLQRAEKILLKTEKNTEKSLKEIIKLYKDTEKVIDNEIKKVYNKYAIDGKLTNKEAKALLNTKESKEIYDNLLIEISKIKNADYKRTLLSKYNAPAYSYRISRWEALKQDISLKIKQLADKEFEISKNNYIDTIENTYFEYNSLINEMQVTGLTSFTTINNNVLNRILETNWLGSNFSKRIWGNSILLENNLNNILKTGLAAGLSYAKMSQQLQETMNTSLFNSTRLIRTETNHFHNEAEYQSYIDDGVTEYEYAAVLDSRTSEICRNLDGKIFKVTEKRTGVNYPPMHPFCRSTTLPVIESIEVKEKGEYVRKNNLTDNRILDDKIKNVIKLFPTYIQEYINDTPIKVVGRNYNNHYLDGTLYLLNDATEGEIIHEIGHLLEDKLNIAGDLKYQQILKSGIENIDVMYGDIGNIKGYSPDYEFVLCGDKFVYEYQRRIYNIDINDNPRINYNTGTLNYNCLRDYLPEGLRYYFTKPQVLKNKDYKLYKYIEEILNE